MSAMTVAFRGARLPGFALGDDAQMPTGYDLIAQGYAPTLAGCFAGQTCYAATVQTVAGPSTRTYAFGSPDPASRSIGTSASAPAGQPAMSLASAGVAPVVTATAPTVSVSPPAPRPASPKRAQPPRTPPPVGALHPWLFIGGVALVSGAVGTFIAIREAR